MSATTTQLLSRGEFCKLRYDTIPVKLVSANVSLYTNNSKMPNFVTLVANERYVQGVLCSYRAFCVAKVSILLSRYRRFFTLMHR